MIRIVLSTLIGGGIAITPSGYYENIRTCETRARTLSVHKGFVNTCLDEAKREGIPIYLSAHHERLIKSLCRNRAMSDLFCGENSFPGTICEDPVTREEINPDCKYVMVARGSSYTSTSNDSVDGQFASQALTRLVTIHAAGFVVGMVSSLGNFNSDAYLRLDPMRMEPLVLESGQLGERSLREVKSDLQYFHKGLVTRFNNKTLVREFGNWIRKIRIDRTAIPSPSEYTEWIARFGKVNPRKRKVSGAPEPKVREVMMRTPAVT